MPKLFFSGVVLPERAQLSVSEVRSQILGLDGKTYATMALNIWSNQISVVVESDEPDIFTLRNIVRSEAEFVTNVAGFLCGYGYDIEITKVVGESLDPTKVFGIEIPVLVERATGRDVGMLVNTIFPLCFGPDAIYIRRCLADLSFAIKRADDTPFYCYRALESLVIRLARNYLMKLINGKPWPPPLAPRRQRWTLYAHSHFLHDMEFQSP